MDRQTHCALPQKCVLLPAQIGCADSVFYRKAASGQRRPLPITHLSKWGRCPSPPDCCPLHCHPSWPVSLGGCGLWLFLLTWTASRQLAETCRGVARRVISLGLAPPRPAPKVAKDQPHMGTGSRQHTERERRALPGLPSEPAGTQSRGIIGVRAGETR